MKKETNNLTFRNVIDELKESRYGFSTQLLYFALLTIVSLIIAYLLPYSLIITVPFVIVPSYFAFVSTNSIKGVKGKEGFGFFFMFKSYFSQLFFGGYRLLIGLLKAFVVFLVSTTALITIFDLTILSSNAQFRSIMEKGQTSLDMQAFVDELNNFLANNMWIQKLFYLAFAIGYCLAALVFLHHINKHSVKMRRNLFSKSPFPIRQFNFVDKRVRVENRGFLFGSYLRTCWFIMILIILAFAGGVVLSFFFLKDFTPEKTLVISLFLVLIVTLPFLNYISKVQDLIYVCLSKTYESTFAKVTLEFLTKYKERIGIEEEDAKKIEELLKMTQEENKEETIEEDNKKDKQ